MIEKFKTNEGSMYFFDHKTLVIKAKHANGYSERWLPNGSDFEQKQKSFWMLTDQWEKVYA